MSGEPPYANVTVVLLSKEEKENVERRGIAA
jgi:hypothetical protein